MADLQIHHLEANRGDAHAHHIALHLHFLHRVHVLVAAGHRNAMVDVVLRTRMAHGGKGGGKREGGELDWQQQINGRRCRLINFTFMPTLSPFSNAKGSAPSRHLSLFTCPMTAKCVGGDGRKVSSSVRNPVDSGAKADAIFANRRR